MRKRIIEDNAAVRRFSPGMHIIDCKDRYIAECSGVHISRIEDQEIDRF